MSEDDSSPLPEKRSWLERLSHAFSGEPESREDLVEILRDARSNRIIEGDTLRMLEGALAVSTMTVADVMVPRAQMVSLPGDGRLLDLMRAVVDSGHSRFPVHGEDRDEILGILLAKDLLPFALKRDTSDFDVKRILRPATFVPESKRLNVLLREFRETRHHMAIVIDEYGSACGVVTIEDVLEQIVGEIDDEYDVDDDSFIKRIDAQNYVVKALTPIAEFNEAFEHDFSDADVDTLGGLVLRHFGHIPERDETVVIGPFRFTILSSDSRQVRLLKVTRLPADGAERSR